MLYSQYKLIKMVPFFILTECIWLLSAAHTYIRNALTKLIDNLGKDKNNAHSSVLFFIVVVISHQETQTHSYTYTKCVIIQIRKIPKINSEKGRKGAMEKVSVLVVYCVMRNLFNLFVFFSLQIHRSVSEQLEKMVEEVKKKIEKF